MQQNFCDTTSHKQFGFNELSHGIVTTSTFTDSSWQHEAGSSFITHLWESGSMRSGVFSLTCKHPNIWSHGGRVQCFWSNHVSGGDGVCVDELEMSRVDEPSLVTLCCYIKMFTGYLINLMFANLSLIPMKICSSNT